MTCKEPRGIRRIGIDMKDKVLQNLSGKILSW